MKRTALFFALATLVTTTAVAQYAPQFGAAVAVSGEQALVGEGRNLLLPGQVLVYTHSADGTWTPSAPLAANDATEEGDGFGRALSADGNTLAVGAPLAGAAYIFTRSAGGAWSQSARLSGDSERFGTSVALHGDHLLVGAPGGREENGAVYAYRRAADGTWTPAGRLTTDTAAAGDGYGTTLAVENDHAVVGAPRHGGNTGAVHTFHYDGGWHASGTLDVRLLQEGHRFGSALLIVGTHLIVGAPGYESGTGMAAVFTFDDEDGAWHYDRRLAPYDARGGEIFGTALAYTPGTLWVGAPGYGQRNGRVYRFQTNAEAGRMAATWDAAPDDLQFRSMYGTALAANEQVAVVGAVGHDNFEGAAFPYTAGDDGWTAGAPLYNDAGAYATQTGDQVLCEDGEAGGFTCSNVDMLSFLSRRDIGAARGIQVNDVWGWEDPATEREYALVGRTDGTSFIDLTDPNQPRYLGDLPMTSTANRSLWRDIKVYKNHAFIVADGAGAHHMQIFDLTQLRNVTTPQTFKETAIYKGIYSSHNIIINEDTGFAYAVGSDSGGETCGGALHMINIQDPVNPSFAGCFADTRTGRRGTGSTHDAQCVTYQGPDVRYRGREICLSSNGNALSIADVTDKANPVAISMAEYPNVAYAHQGWLTEDHRYFYLNDEGDEASGIVEATRTLILDLRQLDEPEVAGEYLADHNAIDHNLYVKGNLMYQTNYAAGLRILDISDPENPTEIGFFDTVPYGKNDNSPVLGAWSNYPFFKSGVIVVTSGREGVFFLKKSRVDI